MRRVLIAALELGLVLLTVTLGFLTLASFIVTVEDFDWFDVP